MADIDSAIYIDFDNIFTCIEKHYSLTVAENFITYIPKWLEFISTFGLKPLSKRVFRKKIVYINPSAFARYRGVFNRAGFRSVDCPPLTSYEKTATDMYMAVDIVNDTFRYNYQDYIILSGDADFSPILLHINELSKNSILLGIGHVSAIYESIATVCIDEQDFISVFKNLAPFHQQISDENTKLPIKEQPRFTPKPGEPLVRVIKKGGVEDATKNKEANSTQPSLSKSETKESKKEVTTINSLSDLASALKMKEAKQKQENNFKSSKCSKSTNYMDTSISDSVDKGEDKTVEKRNISLRDVGLPLLTCDIRRYIFEQAMFYVTSSKSPRHYIHSLCRRVQNQFTNIDKEDIKEYLKYLPYNSLTAEVTADAIFVQFFCSSNPEVMEVKNISPDDLSKLLFS